MNTFLLIVGCIIFLSIMLFDEYCSYINYSEEELDNELEILKRICNSNTEYTNDYYVIKSNENDNWKEEIRQYLECYCPAIFSKFLINRIEEIIESTN